MLFYIGIASATLIQHKNNIRRMSRVCWKYKMDATKRANTVTSRVSVVFHARDDSTGVPGDLCLCVQKRKKKKTRTCCWTWVPSGEWYLGWFYNRTLSTRPSRPLLDGRYYGWWCAPYRRGMCRGWLYGTRAPRVSTSLSVTCLRTSKSETSTHVNPLSPHDALKRHFTSLKTDLALRALSYSI